MKNLCLETQEGMASGANLSFEQQRHLNDCPRCQAVFADYQSMVVLFDQQKNIEIPDLFADKVMSEIFKIQEQRDWFENLFAKIEFWSTRKIVEYGYLTAGFGLGIFSFIRFVAFVFIPAG